MATISYKYYAHDGIIEPIASTNRPAFGGYEVSYQDFLNWAKSTDARRAAINNAQPGETVFDFYQRVQPQILTGTSNVVDSYTNPLTGETLTNVSQDTIRQIEEQVAGIQSGALRDLGGGMTVPVGSAADALSQFTGQNVTQGEYPGSIVPNASVGAAPQTVAGATGGQINIGTADAPLWVPADSPAATLATQGQKAMFAGGTYDPKYGVMSDGVMSEIENFVKKAEANGMVLNPNAEINEKSIDEFLAIAGKEINPYYATQLKLASDQLKRSLGYSEQQLMQNEMEIERKYGTSLRGIGEQSAEQGFAQSGLRRREETELASETQRAIDQGRQALAYNTGTALGQYAQQYGGMGTGEFGDVGKLWEQGLPGFQMPTRTLNGLPQVKVGEATFGRSLGESPYYQLSPEVYSGLVGEQEFARRGAIRSRASEMEEAQRLERTLPALT